MAERAYTEIRSRLLGVIIVEWTGLLTTDTGAPYKAPNFPDKSFQASGTFGAAGAIRIDGSNDPAEPPTIFGELHPADGAAAETDMTDSRPKTALENTLWVRPAVVAGDGTTSLTVRMVATTGARR